jgi:prepilin-type N-terminal cleavage/methylation domain-containing protein
MTLITGDRQDRAFTLIEILAVLTLIAVIMGTVVFGFTGVGSSARTIGSALVKDIQGTYFQSIRKAQILRISFAKSPDGELYVIEAYEAPQAPPPKEDEEAYSAWEKRQEEKEKQLGKLTRDQLKARTLLDEGEFKEIKRKELGGMRLHRFLKPNSSPGEIQAISFLPTGEIDDSLIVLVSESNDYFSIVTESMGGQVRSFTREVTEEEWKNRKYED